jgi:hypothetical protein
MQAEAISRFVIHARDGGHHNVLTVFPDLPVDLVVLPIEADVEAFDGECRKFSFPVRDEGRKRPGNLQLTGAPAYAGCQR